MIVFLIGGLVLGLLSAWYAYYLIGKWFNFYRAKIVDKGEVAPKKREKSILLAVRILLSLIVGGCVVNVRCTLAICVLYLLFLTALFDGFALMIKLIFRKCERFLALFREIQYCRIIPLLLSAILLTYGAWNMSNPKCTEYTLYSEKVSGTGYKIAFLSDLHYATVQDTALVKECAEKISNMGVDLVILGGDILDEGTDKSAMQEVFRVLGGIRSRLGVYLVYGNHDRQTYSENPAYTQTDLDMALSNANITALEDETLRFENEPLVLVGRKDYSVTRRESRKSTEELLNGVDKRKFLLVADHQPKGLEENAEQGVDLQLSGHTHSGQIWPFGLVISATGLKYGRYTEENTTAIVSSGLAGWGFSIRTEGRSEYVIVNILPKQS